MQTFCQEDIVLLSGRSLDFGEICFQSLFFPLIALGRKLLSSEHTPARPSASPNSLQPSNGLLGRGWRCSCHATASLGMLCSALLPPGMGLLLAARGQRTQLQISSAFPPVPSAPSQDFFLHYLFHLSHFCPFFPRFLSLPPLLKGRASTQHQSCSTAESLSLLFIHKWDCSERWKSQWEGTLAKSTHWKPCRDSCKLLHLTRAIPSVETSLLVLNVNFEDSDVSLVTRISKDPRVLSKLHAPESLQPWLGWQLTNVCLPRPTLKNSFGWEKD